MTSTDASPGIEVPVWHKLLWTAEEAAAVLGMRPQTFREKVRLGDVPKPVISRPNGGPGAKWSRIDIERFFTTQP